MATQENKRFMASLVYGVNGDINAWRIMFALHKRQTKREKIGTRTIEVNKRGFSIASTVLCDYASLAERGLLTLVGKNAISAQRLDNVKTHLIVRYGGQIKGMLASGELVLFDALKPIPVTIKRNALIEAQYKAAIDAADMVESED